MWSSDMGYCITFYSISTPSIYLNIIMCKHCNPKTGILVNREH